MHGRTAFLVSVFWMFECLNSCRARSRASLCSLSQSYSRFLKPPSRLPSVTYTAPEPCTSVCRHVFLRVHVRVRRCPRRRQPLASTVPLRYAFTVPLRYATDHARVQKYLKSHVHTALRRDVPLMSDFRDVYSCFFSSSPLTTVLNFVLLSNRPWQTTHAASTMVEVNRHVRRVASRYPQSTISPPYTPHNPQPIYNLSIIYRYR